MKYDNKNLVGIKVELPRIKVQSMTAVVNAADELAGLTDKLRAKRLIPLEVAQRAHNLRRLIVHTICGADITAPDFDIDVLMVPKEIHEGVEFLQEEAEA